MSKMSIPEEGAINLVAPPGFDAQAIPIHQVCADQKRVLPELLQPEALKARLQSPPQWQPEITDENRHEDYQKSKEIRNPPKGDK